MYVYIYIYIYTYTCVNRAAASRGRPARRPASAVRSGAFPGSSQPAIKIHHRGGAVEIGSSDLYGVIH